MGMALTTGERVNQGKKAILNIPEIRECWKAKEAVNNKEKVSEKVKCPYFRIYAHKGVCIGNRKQRRKVKCYR
jgi:hypothetical protein